MHIAYNSNYQTIINTLILNILNTNLKCSNLFDVCKGLNMLFDWSVWVCFIQNTQVLKNAKWLFQLSALLTFEMHQLFSHVYSMFCRSFTRTLIQLINNSRQTKTKYFKRVWNIFWSPKLPTFQILQVFPHYGLENIIKIYGLKYIIEILIDFIGWYRNS